LPTELFGTPLTPLNRPIAGRGFLLTLPRVTTAHRPARAADITLIFAGFRGENSESGPSFHSSQGEPNGYFWLRVFQPIRRPNFRIPGHPNHTRKGPTFPGKSFRWSPRDQKGSEAGKISQAKNKGTRGFLFVRFRRHDFPSAKPKRFFSRRAFRDGHRNDQFMDELGTVPKGLTDPSLGPEKLGIN